MLAANDRMIDEMVHVYTLEVDRVGNPILNGIEGETRSYNGTVFNESTIAAESSKATCFFFIEKTSLS